MKKFYIEILLLAMSVAVFAEQRTAQEAAEIAASFAKTQLAPTAKKGMRRANAATPQMSLSYQVAKPDSNEPALYVFNQEGGGWVIVSADDQSVSVLGYSDKGTFDGTKPNVAYFMDYYAKTIANAQPLSEEQKTQRKASAPRRAKAQESDVDPLLEIEGIEWNQDAPYYNMCPIDRYCGEHSATGCVATAAAMVMRFWKWPAQGIGEYSYVWNNKFDYDETIHHATASIDTVLYANFGATTYDWNNMLPKYESDNYNQTQADAVALLNYHVGVISRMDYGGYPVGGSGSGGDIAGEGMINFFRYKAIRHYSQGDDCDFDTIAKYFSLDLHAGRPVMMGGAPRSGSGSGHAFVCDGMKDFDGEMLYHINWGWGGMSNGYFVLTTLDPDVQGIGGNEAAGGFASGIGFWYGLEPDHNPIFATGISLDKNILSMNVGEKKELVATISPANASSQGMYWTSSNESVATVDYKGKVKGISTGSAIITVKSADGGYTASCNVTVSDGPAVFDTINITFNNGVFEHKHSTSNNNISIGLLGTEGDYYPYMWFQFDGDYVNWKISGYYELGHGNKILGWPTLASYNELGDNKVITSESGWMDISCVASGQYRFQGVFLGDDDNYYKFNDVISISSLYEGETEHNLTDAIETPVEVTWMAQGNEFARNMTLGNRIVIPDGQPASCGNGRVFIGWSATEVNATNIMPTLVQTADIVNGNATYYAVYAEHTAAALYEAASVGFNHYTNDAADLNVLPLMDSLMAYDKVGITEISGTNTFLGKDGVIIGSNDATGWIILNLDKPVAVKKVIVNAGQYGGDNCVIRVLANNSLIGDVQAPAANMEFTARQSVVSNTVKIAVSNKHKHAYISSVSIMTDGGIEGNYSTSCSGTATDSPDITPTNTENLILLESSAYLDRNETKQLTYTVAPYGHKSQTVNWVSSDPSVASVDANGVVTGISAGTATITGTAVDGGYTKTCNVTVSNELYRIRLEFTGVFSHSYDPSNTRMTIGLKGEGDYPWMYLKFYGDNTNWKIAGTYELDGNNKIDGWITEAQYNLPNNPKTTSTSGWMRISCVASGKYRIWSEFVGDDGKDYKFDYVASISDLKNGNTRYTLTDQVGDGADSVFFVSLGDTVAITRIIDGKLALPAQAPTNCATKDFVGWISESSYNSDDAPTFAKAGDATTSNSVYYAVFANLVSPAEPSGVVASIVFADTEDSENPDVVNTSTYWYDDAYIGSKNKWDLVESSNNITDMHGYSWRAGEHGTRIGSSSQDEYGHSYDGWIQLTMGQSRTITKLVITSSKTRDNDKGKLYIDLGDVHDDNAVTCGEDVEYTPANPVNTDLVKIATKEKAAYIKSVTIYASGAPATYDGYTTTCPSAVVSHAITVNTPTNGEASTNANAAEAGETVTITATAHHCYEVGTISVKDAGNNDVTVSNNQFVMPDSDVTVTVNFNLTQYTITAEGEANGDAEVE